MLNKISKVFTLVQLMDILINVNHAISIVGYWIFESKYERALHLTREPLDILCYPSVGEEKVVKFEILFYSLGYLCSPGNLNMG